jgi:MoxR-like ATPase
VEAALLGAITDVLENSSKRLILVTSLNSVTQAHGAMLAKVLKKNPAYGRFADSSAASPASGDARLLKEAVNSPVPANPNADWDWQDNKWVDVIDNMRVEDVEQMIREGWHSEALKRLRAALSLSKAQFCRRDHALEMLVACALARVNLVYLGPPGTAKSLLVRTFAKALGVSESPDPIRQEQVMVERLRSGDKDGKAGTEVKSRKMFEYLLTRYTTPEEIFGGADISLLMNSGVYGRRTAGMLPQAEIGFLDELFKANTAILNALLSLTNERLFYNLGQAFRVNLAFVVGASNETPAEEELGALYDRFPIRVPCLPVRSGEEQHTVMQCAQRDDATKSFAGGASARSAARTVAPLTRAACLNDVRLLMKVVLANPKFGGIDSLFPPGNTTFEQAFGEVLAAVKDEFKVSDRTPYLLLRVCRALALLDGGDELRPRHLRAFGYVAPKVSSALDLQRLLKARIRNWDAQLGADMSLFDEA